MNGGTVKKWKNKRVSIERRDGKGNDLTVIAQQQTYRYQNHSSRGNKHFQPHEKGEYEKTVRQYERQRDSYLDLNQRLTPANESDSFGLLAADRASY